MAAKKLSLSKLIPNPINETIDKASDTYKTFVKYIQEDPGTFFKRSPILVNSKYEILGRSIKYEILKSLKIKDLPESWLKICKKTFKLSNIKENPNNPRDINEDNLDSLVKSLAVFAHKMMPLRPIVYDENGETQGGNMRLKGLGLLGFKEVPHDWVKKISGWTQEEKNEFIIKDNISFGRWDWEDLHANWDEDLLEDWGLELNDLKDYAGKNQEVDIDDIDDKMSFKLEYTADEYELVKERFQEIGGTPEAIIFDLLGLNEDYDEEE